ncbi:MAG: hypothetical protein GF364_08950 [Candidatus Lokiarchaeota archaeon]|nr:hypothetical protein [Candidatus Lokiarchaeota archaeon]
MMGHVLSIERNANIKSFIIAMFIIFAGFVPGIYVLNMGLNLSQPYEKRVCAFYYTWYANTTVFPNEHPKNNDIYEHWNKSAAPFDPYEDLMITHHPNMGFLTTDPILYDSADENLIEYHLALAQEMQIDTFITTWWGENNSIDTNFDLLLNVTSQEGYAMEHTIYFESAQGKYDLTNPACVENICYDIKYVLDSYGQHENYLKIGGRPVIFAFNVYSAASAKNWTSAIDKLNREGYYPYLIADIGYQAPIGQQELDMFDGIHLYNPSQPYLEDFNEAVNDIVDLQFYACLNNMLFCATVLPGYNDTALNKPDPVPVYPRSGGETYNRTWDAALELEPDWILITSFNEWHEGTEIEPSIQHSNQYIEITKNYVEIFKSK